MCHALFVLVTGNAISATTYSIAAHEQNPAEAGLARDQVGERRRHHGEGAVQPPGPGQHAALSRCAPGRAGTAGPAPATPARARASTSAGADDPGQIERRQDGRLQPSQHGSAPATTISDASTMLPLRRARPADPPPCCPGRRTPACRSAPARSPMVRSFSHRLAFSIRKISMNRNPRPSAGKYTIGRSSPISGSAQPARRGQRHQQHQHRDHHRLRQHREIDQRADLRLRQNLQPLQNRVELVQPQHRIEERPVERDRRQVERCARRRRRVRPAPRRASSAMESSGPSEVDLAAGEGDRRQVVVDAGRARRPTIDARIPRHVERAVVAELAQRGDARGVPRRGWTAGCARSTPSDRRSRAPPDRRCPPRSSAARAVASMRSA